MNQASLRIAPALTRHHNRLVVVAVLLLSFAPSVWSDVLIGYYTINAKYNAAGCKHSYDPYLCPNPTLPGPVIIPGLAAGNYRIVVTDIGPGIPSPPASPSPPDFPSPVDVRVWLGNSASGATFLLNNPGIVGSITDFFHPGGNIALYVYDWYPWDNNPWSWTNVALFASLPSSKEDCKKSPGWRSPGWKSPGWKSYGFKNQGQCIKFVNTGKGHPIYPSTPINPIYPPAPNQDPSINEKPILKDKKPKKK